MEHLAKQTAPISDFMPNVAISLSRISADALNVLQQAKPNLVKSSPLDMEKNPSQVEISKFNKLANFIDDPASTLSHVAHGTLTMNHVKVLQSLYPNLLSNMQQAVMNHLIDHQAKDGATIPYATKMGLSRLLGQPLDSSIHCLLPNQIALAGNGVQQAQEQQPQQQTKPSKSGMGQMEIGMRDQTKAQQASERASK
jgi:hypothetical protein